MESIKNSMGCHSLRAADREDIVASDKFVEEILRKKGIS